MSMSRSVSSSVRAARASATVMRFDRFRGGAICEKKSEIEKPTSSRPVPVRPSKGGWYGSSTSTSM